MSKFSLTNTMGGTQQAMTTTYKTVVAITSATGATTLRRAWIYDVQFDADGAPADNTVVYKVDRQNTALGTATTPSPLANPLDPFDAATLMTTRINHTAEPTLISNSQLIERAINQKTSYRWCTLPGSGAELVVPATDLTGVGLRAKGLSSGYTGTVLGTVHYYE